MEALSVTRISYLVQQTCNRLLDLISEIAPQQQKLPNDLSLSQQLDVSRTTIRKSLERLQEIGLIEAQGSSKRICREPQRGDYFDLSKEPSSKEALIETYFLSLISSGRLLPGDKFSELELAQKSGCNTITVREFLIKFSRFGLIQKKPRAQWQMVEFDSHFAQELVEFRKMLEAAALEKLMQLPTTHPVWDKLQSLLDAHLDLRANFDRDFGKLPELDELLHRTLQEAASNRFISQFFDIVSVVCHYHYQWDKRDLKTRHSMSVNEHIELLQKILSHNKAAAMASMEKHLSSVGNTLLHSAQGLK